VDDLLVAAIASTATDTFMEVLDTTLVSVSLPYEGGRAGLGVDPDVATQVNVARRMFSGLHVDRSSTSGCAWCPMPLNGCASVY
jgi:hypothetical protein